MTKYRVQGISFPDEELFVAALRKARSQRRSLSNYICGLLEADLQNSGHALREEATEPINSKSDEARNRILGGGARLVSYRRRSSRKPSTGKGPEPDEPSKP